MLQRLLQLLILLTCVCYPFSIFAEDLLQVYTQAVISDPILRASAAERDAVRENYPQALGALLPNVEGIANFNQVEQRSLVGTKPPVRNLHDARNLTLSIVQPIFDAQKWASLQKSHSIVDEGNANYEYQKQDLILRVAKAYFDVLEAEDNVEFARAEKRANAKHLDESQQRFKVGLLAITGVHDSQAAYDDNVAKEITAKNVLTNKMEALSKLTGHRYQSLTKLAPQLPLLYPNPNDANTWVEAATRQNLKLIAKRHAVEATRLEFKKNQANRLPIVSLVGSFNDQERVLVGIGNTDVQTNTASIQIDVPLYKGGALGSLQKQARYHYDAAVAQLDETYRETVVTARQTFNTVVSGISNIKARRQAVVSSQSSLDSTEEAYKVGTRTIVDVLDAQNKLFDARSKLSASTYAYINDILKLKQSAGNLSDFDVELVNAWLHGRKDRTLPRIVKNTPQKPLIIIGHTPATQADAIHLDLNFLAQHSAPAPFDNPFQNIS